MMNMPRAHCIYTVLILALLTLGCGTGDRAPKYASNVENVIVVVIDTLRANHLGFMGYRRLTSPNLDEFSERCIIFDNAYCPRSLTLPSFTSLWTGLHTIHNGIFQNAWPLADDLHLLVEDFRDAGFYTIGGPASDILAKRHGIGRGFEVYDQPENPPRLAGDAIDTVVGEMENADGQMFVFFHFWEPHSPYEPESNALAMFADPLYSGPMDGSVEVMNAYNLNEIELGPDDIRHAIDRYDAEIFALDRHLGNLFEYFDETGLTENSIIIVTADHGESLGEGHFFQHLRDTEIELHIPLMFHFPGDLDGGIRIDALVEITDILPTIMEILDVPIPEGIDGISMRPLLDGSETEIHDHLLSVGTKHEDRYLYSTWDGVTRSRVDVPVMPDPRDLDPETQERLRSLGYIN